jgi:hypothetical protein
MITINGQSENAQCNGASYVGFFQLQGVVLSKYPELHSSQIIAVPADSCLA